MSSFVFKFVVHIQAVMVDPMKEFQEQMGREPVLPFDCFWSATEEESRQEYEAECERRCVPVGADMNWESTFLPSQRDRHDLYQLMTGAGFTRQSGSHAGKNGMQFAFDLDQNPTRRPRISCTLAKVGEAGEPGILGLLMCLVSHGLIVMDGEPLLAVDWLGIHGYERHPHGENPFAQTILSLLKSKVIDHNQVKSMVGNGWHLGSMGLLYMKLLSSLELRRPAKLARQLSGLETPLQRTPEKGSVNEETGSPVVIQDSPPTAEKLKVLGQNIGTHWLEFGF